MFAFASFVLFFLDFGCFSACVFFKAILALLPFFSSLFFFFDRPLFPEEV